MNEDLNGVREQAVQKSVARVFQVAGTKALGQERPSRPRKDGGEKDAEDNCFVLFFVF